MSIRPLVIAAALLATLLAPIQAQEHGVKVLDDAWVKAIKAGDLEALTALYSQDAVLYPPDAFEARGTTAIRESYKNTLAAIIVTDATITAQYVTDGDVSYGYGTARLVASRRRVRMTRRPLPLPGDAYTAVPEEPGPTQTMEVRVTAIARRINGQWRYVVDHMSVPVAQTPEGPAATPPAH